MKYADVVTATTHKALRGPRGGMILSTKEFAKGVDKNIFPDIQLFFFYSLLLNKSILISKVTTIPILISSNPIVIWGEGNTI